MFHWELFYEASLSLISLSTDGCIKNDLSEESVQRREEDSLWSSGVQAAVSMKSIATGSESLSSSAALKWNSLCTSRAG